MSSSRFGRGFTTRCRDLVIKHYNQDGLGLTVSGHSTSATGGSSKDSPVKDLSRTEGSTTSIEDGLTSCPSVYELRTPASTQSRESSLYARYAGPIYLCDAEPDQLSGLHYENTDYEADKGHPLQRAVRLSLADDYTAPCRGASCSPARRPACSHGDASNSDTPHLCQTSTDS